MQGERREADKDRLPGDTSCGEAQRSLDAYVEGELEGRQLALVGRHVERCPDCSARVLELERERLRVLEAAVDAPALPETFAREVAARALAERRRILAARRRETLFRLSGVAAAAAALLLAVVLGPAPPERATAGGRPVASLPERRSGGIEFPGAASAAAPAPPNGRGLKVLHEIVFAAYRLSPYGGNVWIPEHQALCLPDPNSDGRSDINDVAFSFQLMMPDAPLSLIAEEAIRGDPDCVDICLKL